MENNSSYIQQAFVETPWAIVPRNLVVLQEIVSRHVAGEKLDPLEIQARIHGATRPEPRTMQGNAGKNVAVLPLFGTIFPRANLMTDLSGATSAEMFIKQFRELIADENYQAIVLDVDSPGGQASGIQEASQAIYEARGSKPVIAVANHLMASAAYWIGTAADELVVSPSGEIGSVGVLSIHRDISMALQSQGVKMSVISKGKYKGLGNPYEPLTLDSRAIIEEKIGEIYDSFVEDIARNRGVSSSAVRDGFGNGRTVGARQAVALGMADRVGTLEQVIDQLVSGYTPPALLGPSEPQPSAVDVERESRLARLRERVSPTTP